LVLPSLSTSGAFAALRADGAVVTWGYRAYGGDSAVVASALSGSIDVTAVYANKTAFAAVRADGSVITWGAAGNGGDSAAVAAALNGSIDVVRIVATDSAFAALRADGSVVTWGDALGGGDASAVGTALDGTLGVTDLYATGAAFAARRADGSLVTWGDFLAGGDSTEVSARLSTIVGAADILTNDSYVVQTVHNGTTGPDTLVGSPANDTLRGFAGNDAIDGLGGRDLAVYAATRAQATLKPSGAGLTVTTPAEGTDTLANVERLQFADGFVAIDLGGNAGTVAKVIGAMFGLPTLKDKAVVGNALGRVDAGMSELDLIAWAIDSDLFLSLAGSRSNTAFVDLVYANVVGVKPGPADLAHFVGLLDSGLFTQATLGLLAAEIDINQAHVDLVGLAGSGLDYTPG